MFNSSKRKINWLPRLRRRRSNSSESSRKRATRDDSSSKRDTGSTQAHSAEPGATVSNQQPTVDTLLADLLFSSGCKGDAAEKTKKADASGPSVQLVEKSNSTEVGRCVSPSAVLGQISLNDNSYHRSTENNEDQMSQLTSDFRESRDASVCTDGEEAGDTSTPVVQDMQKVPGNSTVRRTTGIYHSSSSAGSAPPAVLHPPLLTTSASSVQKEDDDEAFPIHQRIRIVSKKDHGEIGTIVGKINKITYNVKLDHNGLVVNKKTKSLERLEESTETAENAQERHHKENLPKTMMDDTSSGMQQPSFTNGDTTWTKGQRIEVIKSKDAGKFGFVVEKINKITLKIQLDGVVGTTNKRIASLQAVTDEDTTFAKVISTSSTESIVSAKAKVHQRSVNDGRLAVGTSVYISSGKYRNKVGHVIDWKGAKSYTIQIEGLDDTAKVRSSSVVELGGEHGDTGGTYDTLISGEEWRVADWGWDRGGSMFGSRRIIKMRLGQPHKFDKEPTFLSHVLGYRTLLTEIPLDKDEDKKTLDVTIEKWGDTFELVCSKLHDDNDGSNGHFEQSKCARAYYAKVTGPHIQTLSLTDELLKIADFASLVPRKVMARLELLCSPSHVFPKTKKPAMFFVKAGDFEVRAENGNVGCGFVSVAYVRKLLEASFQTGKNSGQALKEADALLGVQVRIIIPSMGLFKGMLRVVDSTGGRPVLLFPSMQKVGPSKHPATDDRACIVVIKNGFHSNSKANEYIGRKLNPDLKDPPVKSFRISIKKPLSKMILRLWKDMGVSQDRRDEYVKRCVEPKYREHAWLVGMSDSMAAHLPEGTVFVTGLQGSNVQKVFVTRSPCTQVEHGRLLPIVTSKPAQMSDREWNYLNCRPFGAIIFSNPPKGMQTMPERIASGDLDGDLYFVCWNLDILDQMQATPMQDKPIEQEETGAPVSENAFDADNHQWFTDARAIMVDFEAERGMCRLMGALYTLLEVVASEASLQHPDAIILGEAFDLALEFRKHGKPIVLPPHLRNKLPERVRKYVQEETPQ